MINKNRAVWIGIIAVLMLISRAFALDGCPQSNHFLGRGHTIKNGECTKSNSWYRKIFILSFTHAGCDVNPSKGVHCSLIPQKFTRETVEYYGGNGCSGSSSVVSSSEVYIYVLNIGPCNYTTKDEDKGA